MSDLPTSTEGVDETADRRADKEAYLRQAAELAKETYAERAARLRLEAAARPIFEYLDGLEEDVMQAREIKWWKALRDCFVGDAARPQNLPMAEAVLRLTVDDQERRIQQLEAEREALNSRVAELQNSEDAVLSKEVLRQRLSNEPPAGVAGERR